MNRRAVCMGALVALALVGCKRGGDDKAAGGSGRAAGSAAVVGAPGCRWPWVPRRICG